MLFILLSVAAETICTPLSEPVSTLLPSTNQSEIIPNDEFCKQLRPPGYEALANNETYFPCELRSFWGETDRVFIYLLNNQGYTWRGVLMQVRHEDVPVGTMSYIRRKDGSDKEALVNCPPGRANTFYLTTPHRFNFMNMLWSPPEGFTMNQTLFVHVTVMTKAGKHYWKKKKVIPVLVDNLKFDDVSFYGLEHHLSETVILSM